MLQGVDEPSALHTTASVFASRTRQLVKQTERKARSEIGAKQRAYLRDTLHELNITASRMAGMLGMAPSTFTRFINLPDSSEKTMHPATIDKVEKLRQVNSDSPFPTTAQGSWATLREEAARLDMESGDTALLQALRSLIGDREGIEPWRLNTRALELEGYMPGDIVLVDLNASPQAGDAVYATIREQSRVEPIMRKFQPTGIVDLLVPRTNDPDAPPTLVVDRKQVLIRGVLLPHRLRGRMVA
jgi:hypothetical protein